MPDLLHDREEAPTTATASLGDIQAFFPGPLSGLAPGRSSPIDPRGPVHATGTRPITPITAKRCSQDSSLIPSFAPGGYFPQQHPWRACVRMQQDYGVRIVMSDFVVGTLEAWDPMTHVLGSLSACLADLVYVGCIFISSIH